MYDHHRSLVDPMVAPARLEENKSPKGRVAEPPGGSADIPCSTSTIKSGGLSEQRFALPMPLVIQ